MTDILPTPQQIIASAIANQANAVMGIYGISGAGKSSLADTGCEECYETHGKITLCYAADLGGFGNKRLTLIRRGIMRVWDPRNHINPFETMELMALGAFPERLIDPERGFADPNVPLILPRRLVYVMYCPQGHEVKRFEDQRVMSASSVACPTCGTVTGVTNASKVEQQIVRHKMFTNVGLRIYDSFTSLNEWGMADLQEQSARGLLPASHGGSSMLGSADALRSGRFVFGGSSIAQYGFLQNRTYGWLSNIKTIPDQVMPAIATFMVEQSKGDDESGGEMLYGPKIAGNARTSALGGWLGHLLHATKEPYAKDDAQLVYRLWMTNHIDPRDARKIPYIAKHRGTPLGMPDYLEDEPGKEPWSGCSLKVFYRLQREQLARLEREAQEKYPDAPGMWRGEGEESDEVVATATPQGTAAPVAIATPAAKTGRRRVGGPMAGLGGPVAAMHAQPVPIVQQLEASLAERAGSQDGGVAELADVGAANADTQRAGSTPAPATTGQETAALATPSITPAATVVVEAPPIPSPAAPSPAPPTSPAGSQPTTRLRRVARPPV